MHTPSFADRLDSGYPLLGSWCNFASFACTELMASLGFDFLVLDMQHCELTQAQFPSFLAASPKEGGPSMIVRAQKNDYHSINWLFDQGVDGVLVPMINCADDAKKAVEAAKFPPVGRRSFGPHRAAEYGANLEAYMADADRHATLIIQVENADALCNIEQFFGIPGIDAIFMGPNDIAFSMLKNGESYSGGSNWTAFARPQRLLDLCDEAMRKCIANGIPFGMTAGSMDEARHWMKEGARLVTFGSDTMFIRAGAKALCGPPPDTAAV